MVIQMKHILQYRELPGEFFNVRERSISYRKDAMENIDIHTFQGINDLQLIDISKKVRHDIIILRY